MGKEQEHDKFMDQSSHEQDSSKLEKEIAEEVQHGGRDVYYMDIDRMVNEGLGGGQVTYQNGLIDNSTTDTMGIDEEEVE